MDSTLHSEDRQDRIDGLRKMADWLEAHPEAHAPGVVAICDAPGGRDLLVKRARTLGGRWSKVEKDEDDRWFELRLEFGPDIYYELFTLRSNVCERIVVGTEEREVEGPDPELVAQLPTTKRTETVEKVEWKCPGSLLALDTSEELSAEDRMDRIGVVA